MIDKKAAMRKDVLERRKRLGEAAIRDKSQLICEKIISLLTNHSQLDEGTLFTYMPFGEETDIFPVAEWCWRQGIPTAVPLTLKEPRTLRWHLINDRKQLKPGVWGIPEPTDETPLADPGRIGVIVVPGVAFDRFGGRLGYGGGYYDRFFGDLRERGLNPLKLAPAFDTQLVDEVPVEQHDERIDLIITETECLKKIEGGGVRGSYDGSTG